MDHGAAIAKLEEILGMIAAYDRIANQPAESHYWEDPAFKDLETRIRGALPTAEVIAGEVDSQAGQQIRDNVAMSTYNEFENARRGIVRAIGVLRDREETRADHGPSWSEIGSSSASSLGLGSGCAAMGKRPPPGCRACTFRSSSGVDQISEAARIWLRRPSPRSRRHRTPPASG